MIFIALNESQMRVRTIWRLVMVCWMSKKPRLNSPACFADWIGLGRHVGWEGITLHEKEEMQGTAGTPARLVPKLVVGRVL